MSDLERRRANRPSRRAREQRAYRLVVVGGTAGLVSVAGLVLAIFGIVGSWLWVLAAVVAVICAVLFRRTVRP
jgi:putative flippase GtrA